MKESLEASLRKLKSIAPQLNKATDEATAIVRRVERFLSETCSIGIEAGVLLPPIEGETLDEPEVELKYCRECGKYRICVQTWFEEPVRDEDGVRVKDAYGRDVMERRDVQCIPWASCPRGVKLKAHSAMPQLLAEIVKKAEALIESSSEATEATAKVLSALGPVDV